MNARVASRFIQDFIQDKERKVPRIQARAGFAASPNRWSIAVRSWVAEFQQRDRNESLPDFNNLFKDGLSESAPAD